MNNQIECSETIIRCSQAKMEGVVNGDYIEIYQLLKQQQQQQQQQQQDINNNIMINFERMTRDLKQLMEFKRFKESEQSTECLHKS